MEDLSKQKHLYNMVENYSFNNIVDCGALYGQTRNDVICCQHAPCAHLCERMHVSRRVALGILCNRDLKRHSPISPIQIPYSICAALVALWPRPNEKRELSFVGSVFAKDFTILRVNILHHPYHLLQLCSLQYQAQLYGLR